MALSNIIREPRREIIETAVGLAFWVPILFGLYLLSSYLHSAPLFRWDAWAYNFWAWFFSVVMAIIIGLASWLFIIVVHDTGDALCNTLQNAGIHLRPRNRR